MLWLPPFLWLSSFISFLPRSIAERPWTLAFSRGGFGEGGLSKGKHNSGGFGKKATTPTTSVAPTKKIRKRPKILLDEESFKTSSNEPQQQQQQKLDKWGLPLPTLDDIFPPMPPGTELKAISKDSYTVGEIQELLKKHLPLNLDRFNESAMEKHPPSDGRLPMKITLLHESPPVLVIDNFFTPEECQATERVAFSTDKNDLLSVRPVQVDSKTFELSQSTRTSTSWFCYYHQVPHLLAKCHSMLGIALEQMEEPQIVRYQAGQEFSWHYDEVPLPQLSNGGQRLATLLVYLNTVTDSFNQHAGGATVFRDLLDRHGNQLAVHPVQGRALLFFPALANGQPDDRTLHRGEMVSSSASVEKRIIQMWIHQRAYQAAVPQNNRQEDAIEAVNEVMKTLGQT